MENVELIPEKKKRGRKAKIKDIDTVAVNIDTVNADAVNVDAVNVDAVNVDVDTELMGLTRKNSKDPNEHYKPSEEKIVKYLNLEDGFFHQESTLLNNPPHLLRGQTKNRWESVFKNPQENIIEPFNRLGENTYLDLVDGGDECEAPQ